MFLVRRLIISMFIVFIAPLCSSIVWLGIYVCFQIGYIAYLFLVLPFWARIDNLNQIKDEVLFTVTLIVLIISHKEDQWTDINKNICFFALVGSTFISALISIAAFLVALGLKYEKPRKENPSELYKYRIREPEVSLIKPIISHLKPHLIHKL